MGRTIVLLVLLLLAHPLTAPVTAGEGEGRGIRWEVDLDAGLARAALEGRPVLFAINALAQESANQRLRHDLYPSPAWGEATREYVCFVANPDVHASEKGGCGTYPGIPCEAHQAVLRYVAHRFDPVSGALISPQHIVLEPDGAVAFRKEYYTGVVSPGLLESLWVRIAPELAYERAGAERAKRIEALEGLANRPLFEDAGAWLRSGDALAAAGLLRSLDFASDDARRLELVRALAATPRDQLPVVDLLADEHGARPDDRPDEALALARALLTADRARGLRLLARILVNTGSKGLGSKARTAWLVDPGSGARHRSVRDLPARERALLAEALLLTGDRSAPKVAAPDVPEDLRPRLRRARVAAGVEERLHPTLPAAFEDGRAGTLRASLYEASPEAVRKHAAAVRRALRERPEARVRQAAAIALLGAGLDEGGRVAPLVWEAVNDPVEGPEARREAVRRLGEDPGWNEAVWLEAATSQAAGGRK